MAGLGIVVALAAEARSLGLSCPKPGLQDGPAGARVHLSGMREARARTAALALADAGATALLSFGSAGGLDPRLESGALVVASEVVHESGVRYPADAAWRARLIAAAAAHEIPLEPGPVLSTGAVLLNSGIKFLARTQSQALVVDLESAAVAAVAAERGLPFLAIRAVSDDSESRLPDGVLDSVDDYGRAKPLKMAAALVAGPGDWFLLPRVAADFSRATGALRALRDAVPDFGWPA